MLNEKTNMFKTASEKENLSGSWSRWAVNIAYRGCKISTTGDLWDTYITT